MFFSPGILWHVLIILSCIDMGFLANSARNLYWKPQDSLFLILNFIQLIPFSTLWGNKQRNVNLLHIHWTQMQQNKLIKQPPLNTAQYLTREKQMRNTKETQKCLQVEGSSSHPFPDQGRFHFSENKCSGRHEKFILFLWHRRKMSSIVKLVRFVRSSAECAGQPRLEQCKICLCILLWESVLHKASAWDQNEPSSLLVHCSKFSWLV